VAFAVCVGLVTSTWPRAHPVLYLHHPSQGAAPACISGRTSYLHVRLAFHLYPQVIPQFCNTGEFEPRRPFTAASLCSWIAHVVSGRIGATLALSPGALVTLGFPTAPLLWRRLTRDVDALAGSFYKRHAISPCYPRRAEWPLAACKHAVSGSLSSPLRGAFHLSLTVLVHYRSLSVFCLGGWSPLLPTNSPGFVVLRMPVQHALIRATGLSPPLAVPSSTFASKARAFTLVLQPRSVSCETQRFGLFPVRSPLLWESRLIACRQATEMFQFAYDPPPCLSLQHGVSRHDSGGVAPLGISGLNACMQLPLNVSPVSASFIGLQRLGIHRVLSRACLLASLHTWCVCLRMSLGHVCVGLSDV
jgi:hypothetical protein